MKRVSKTVFAVLLIACIVASIAMAAFAANTSGTKVTGYKINSNNTDNQYNTSLEIYKGLTLTYVVSLANYGYSQQEIDSIKEDEVVCSFGRLRLLFEREQYRSCC